LLRVTAAILINDRMVRSADGKHVTWVPRTPAEMREIQQLAQAAVGFNMARGDQVTVQNIGFASNATAASPGLATRLIATAGENMGYLRYGVLLVAFLLVLIFIVRPVLGQINQLSSSVQTLPANGHTPLASFASGAAPLDQTEELSFERQQARAQVLFDHVSDYMKKEPQQGTRLLQSWVRSANKS
ncbi:MAG: flagellar M-ring protein FliF C-terminal domain-containing protein, partial [Acidobacteriaceae bacterium]